MGNNRMLMFLVVFLILFMVVNSGYTAIPTVGIDLASLPNMSGRSIDTHIVSFVHYMSDKGMILALLPGTYTYHITLADNTTTPPTPASRTWDFSSVIPAQTITQSLSTKLPLDLSTSTTVTDLVHEPIPLTKPYTPFQLGIMSVDGKTFNDLSTGLMQIGTMPDPNYTLCDCYTFLDALISSTTRYAVRTESYIPLGFGSRPFDWKKTETATGYYYLSNPGITITDETYNPVGDYICRYKGSSDTQYA